MELIIDRDIQWAAQHAISRQVEKSKADGGYVIVQDTATGEILAMANSPDFDPGDLATADPDALGNATLQDAFEASSTAKVMSIAAVLEEKAASPMTRLRHPEPAQARRPALKDDIDHPTWYLTLNGVLAESSSIGTIMATGELGRTQRRPTRCSTPTCASSASAATAGSGFIARPRASSRRPTSGRPRNQLPRFLSARASP